MIGGFAITRTDSAQFSTKTVSVKRQAQWSFPGLHFVSKANEPYGESRTARSGWNCQLIVITFTLKFVTIQLLASSYSPEPDPLVPHHTHNADQ